MLYEIADFNGAAKYFESTGAQRWGEIDDILTDLIPQFQPSDQASKIGEPIFDPKGTNAKLTTAAAALGWNKIPVPDSLRPFGLDWDGGKGTVIAEWQFSNYPFLWNNVIRSEAVFQSKARLPQLSGPVEALIVVTKSGRLPSSNSTLYYEQARAQLNTVTTLGVFELPIRIVGLTIEDGATEVDIAWNTYQERYGRVAVSTRRTMGVTWGAARQYGHRPLKLS